MDIEKLAERIGQEAYGSDIEDLLLDAATALSTLQAENAQLRADLEYEREHANAYHEECGQWEAENEKLRAELEQIPSCIYYKQGGLCRYGGDDPANVCVLGPCDHDVSVQDVLTELEQVKAERDAAIEDIRKLCPAWKWDGQKED